MMDVTVTRDDDGEEVTYHAVDQAKHLTDGLYVFWFDLPDLEPEATYCTIEYMEPTEGSTTDTANRQVGKEQ